MLANLTQDHVKAARQELARRSLRDFSCMIDIPTAPVSDECDEDEFSTIKLDSLAAHHDLLLSKLEKIESGEIKNLMVLMPPGSAKALALDTPIPTPRGWTTIGKLRVGDKVFDENGKVCKVTWKSPVWRDRPVFKIKTDCGDEIIADKDHEWLVRSCGKREVYKIKETWELCKKRNKRVMIKRAKALELKGIKLPIDPYFLGVWLGDGNSSGTRITSDVNDQIWLRKELESIGYKTNDTSVKTLFSVKGVRKLFMDLKLLNDPHHKVYGRKHIPQIYMRASSSQRLSLLQGLIDTDGTVCKKRGCTTFCNTNKALALQVRELVRSLGVKAGWSETKAMLNGKCCGMAYKVSFYLKDSARMPRKRELTIDQCRTPDTYIDVVEYGIADTVCIEVDSPSHLFLCGKSMTPTHNSTYVDVVFIPWFMSKQKRRNVILASYASEIAEKQGRRARQLINSKAFKNLLNVELKTDQKSVHNWALTNGSEYMAGGILSGLTGNRAHLGILDDPIRGREAAESETIRNKTWDAYIDDFCSRLIPGAPQIMILTRWHEDDPAGRILPEGWNGESGDFEGRDGRQWHVICLPAIADRKDDPLGREIGQVLWPEWFSKEHFEPFKKKRRTWSSLYQQKPSPEEGTYFKKEWFRRYRPGSEPIALNKYMTSDHAPSGTENSDYTVFRIWGVAENNDLYLLDGFAAQETLDKSAEKVFGDKEEGKIGLIKKHNPFCWFPENDNNWKSISGFVNKEMRKQQSYCRIEPLTTAGGDKQVKAQAFQGMASMGMVWIPDTPEGDEIIDQYVKFPAGKNDDEVDNGALIGRAINDAHPAIIKPERKEELPPKVVKHKATSWRTR